MRNIDQLGKLWILNLVIRHGSLKKAAIQAKISPSAVSQSLTALEKKFGKTLLIRERGSIIPSQEALAILESVMPAFHALERLDDLNFKSVPKMAWLTFGTYESLAIDLLPGLIHSLKSKCPNLRLRLRISRTANLLTLVRKGELCSALITETDDLSRFYVKEVAEDRLGFFVSNKHPIAEDSWSAIQKHGYGSLAPGKDGLPRYFTKFLHQFDIPKPMLLSDSFETIRAAAAAGTMVGVLPYRVAKRFDDLFEITTSAPSTKKIKESGRHRIVLVSQSNCDIEEADFLADESRRFLGKKT